MHIIRFFTLFLSFLLLELVVNQFIQGSFFPLAFGLLLGFIVSDDVPWYVIAIGVGGVAIEAHMSQIALEKPFLIIGLMIILKQSFYSLIAHNIVMQSLCVMTGLMVFMAIACVYPLIWWRLLLAVLISPFVVYCTMK